MQTLYAMPSEAELNTDQKIEKLLDEKLSDSLDLFVASIMYTFAVARYAETDARQKASRYMPSEADKNINTKIAGNTFMWAVLENNTYTQKVNQDNLEKYLDSGLVKKLYQKLTASPEYHSYIVGEHREAQTEKAIIRFIWENLIAGDEKVLESFADDLPGWEDDQEMIVMLMQNFFKSNSKINYLSLLSGEKKEYARDLLRITIEKEDYSMAQIQPRLQNWDSERVAFIDLLLLRLGVCEMLYFPTIPAKVTINEYIDIAKTYSTPESGNFVNGVLDNLRKQFETQNLLNKQDRIKK